MNIVAITALTPFLLKQANASSSQPQRHISDVDEMDIDGVDPSHVSGGQTNFKT
jgi:hypothetical protein